MLVGDDVGEGVAEEGPRDLSEYVPKSQSQADVAQDKLGYGHSWVQVASADAYLC